MPNLIHKEDLAAASFSNNNTADLGGVAVRVDAGSTVGDAIDTAIAAIPGWTGTVMGLVEKAQSAEIIDGDFVARTLPAATQNACDLLDDIVGTTPRDVMKMVFHNAFIRDDQTFTIGTDFANVSDANAWLRYRRLAPGATITMQFPAGVWVADEAPESHPDGHYIYWRGAPMAGAFPNASEVTEPAGLAVADVATLYTDLLALASSRFATRVEFALPTTIDSDKGNGLGLYDLLLVNAAISATANSFMHGSNLGVFLSGPTTSLIASGSYATVSFTDVIAASTAGAGLVANTMTKMSITGDIIVSAGSTRDALSTGVAASFNLTCDSLFLSGGLTAISNSYNSQVRVLTNTANASYRMRNNSASNGTIRMSASSGLVVYTNATATLDVKNFAAGPSMQLVGAGSAFAGELQKSNNLTLKLATTGGARNVSVEGPVNMEMRFKNVEFAGATTEDVLVRQGGNVRFNLNPAASTPVWSGAAVMAVRAETNGRVNLAGALTTGSAGVTPAAGTLSATGAFISA